MYQIAGFLATIIGIYQWILIIYIFMSWVPSIQNSSIGRLFARLCDPYLDPFRRFIPPIGMLDISPIAAIFVLYLAESGVRYLPYLFG